MGTDQKTTTLKKELEARGETFRRMVDMMAVLKHQTDTREKMFAAADGDRRMLLHLVSQLATAYHDDTSHGESIASCKDPICQHVRESLEGLGRDRGAS